MPDFPLAPDALFLSFQSALAGRYSIDRELGRGGMGVVYLAREVHLDRMVAIKLLPPALATRPALRERFVREAQLAAKLSHPHIIPIHAVAEADEFVYFVMAFVEGESLAQRVQARGPLSASEGTRVIREVAWALGYAHGQGLVHRDVKPDNILLEHGSGRAIVVDFGIAAANGEMFADTVMGTPEFMSPEQAMGASTDARSDLYSLGATAYYALSGHLPFDGKTAAQLLARQIHARAPMLNTVAATVPRKLASLVDSCLSKEPANRPSSASALADQLGLAIEQRRELPAALRAFVKRTGRMDGGGTILGLGGSLVSSTVVASIAGVATGAAVFVASVIALPLGFGIAAARRLLNQGFDRGDLTPAFRAERESIREEHSVQHRSGFSIRALFERIVSKTARVSGATGLLLAPLVLANSGSYYFARLGTVDVALLFIAAVSGFCFLLLMQLRRDVDIEFWSAAWTGQFGAFSFAVARRLRGAKPVAAAMTHRATELSLGMAAEGLFDSLPKASRDALGDVPATLQRLQSDAHRLRLRYDALQDALAGAGNSATGDDYSEVRAERDVVHERMRETVGALETIRLGLLRLHAGSMSLEGLTTHIGTAREASNQVDRLIAANSRSGNVPAPLGALGTHTGIASCDHCSSIRKSRLCRASWVPPTRAACPNAHTPHQPRLLAIAMLLKLRLNGLHGRHLLYAWRETPSSAWC